jgi:hypothetical protein
MPAAIVPHIPTVHLNGTNGEALRSEYEKAYYAIQAAIDALSDATLNGRDFYPQGPDAFYEARDQRKEAFSCLFAARDYAGRIVEGIDAQLP